MRAPAVLLYRSQDSSPLFPGRRGIARALCGSLLVHAWLAWELPGGAVRLAGDTPQLLVRLAPVEHASDPVAPPRHEGDAEPERRMPAAAIPARSVRPQKRLSEAADISGRAAVHGDDWGARHPDPAYYSARELDTYPSLLAPLSIVYPERALRDNRPGRVAALVMIDAAGRVNGVDITHAEPSGYFEEAARKTLEAALFSAARRGGLPVNSRVTIHLDFDPVAVAARD